MELKELFYSVRVKVLLVLSGSSVGGQAAWQ